MRSLLGTILGVAVVAGVCACVSPEPPPPPPEAVLEGTWQLTGVVLTPGISDFLISFDGEGNITRLTYRVNDLVTVYVDETDFIDSDGTVNGDDVSIIASWFEVNHFAFSGTLNSNQTRIDGNASYKLVVGGLTIEAPLGQARLTKQ
jgi:hypothetical protein